jgi:hypothetical protein
MLVYRDDSRCSAGAELKRGLCAALAAVRAEDEAAHGEAVLAALLRAGEFECALSDLADAAAPAIAQITDALAAALVRGPTGATGLAQLELRLEGCPLPEQRLRLKVPEGYAYYGLHPARYAELARALAQCPDPVGVVGVRSIGTSLGAVVCQTLRQAGRAAERISVRPEGHPWERVLHPSAEERRFVQRIRGAGGRFAVVDEGPGLSGSTLLAVCEAIEACGVPRERISMLCSHRPDPTRLLVRGAAERWSRYRCLAAAPPASRPGRDLSAGAWRAPVFGDDARGWPACSTQLERAKWLCPEGDALDKFEGLGPYGDAAFARARTLAAAGFAPEVQRAGGGYLRYAWLRGRPLTVSDASPKLLTALARYCAFRREAFAVSAERACTDGLVEMLRINTREALGLDIVRDFALELRSPVVPDARMQPHEWRQQGGALLKIDGDADGDAHILPGPADVCWDLAGAIVEWELDTSAQAMLVEAYERLSGDGVRARLHDYVACYCAFRVGVLTLAGHTATEPEAERLSAARSRYAARLRQALAHER